MRSCAAVTLVLMLLLFGIPWLAEAPGGGQAPSEPLAAEEQRADADIALTVWDGQALRQMTMAEYLPGVVRGRCPPPSPSRRWTLRLWRSAPSSATTWRAAARMPIRRRMSVPPRPAAAPTCRRRTQRPGGGTRRRSTRPRCSRQCGIPTGRSSSMTARPFWRPSTPPPPGSRQIPGTCGPPRCRICTAWRPRRGRTASPTITASAPSPRRSSGSIFLAAHGDADLSGDPAEWFRDRTVNDSGRVEHMTIGGVSVKGTEVRQLFSLRSACFTVDTGEEGVAFRVTGFGHGVGMSQYGARCWPVRARRGRRSYTGTMPTLPLGRIRSREISGA